MSRSVDWTKKTRDGQNHAYLKECQGLEVSSSQCKGELAMREKQYESFGTPAITHSMLCEAHNKLLGFVTMKVSK